MSYSKSQVAWDAQNTTQVKIKLNNRTDSDIIAWLDHQPNKQGAIKQMIRDEINRTRA